MQFTNYWPIQLASCTVGGVLYYTLPPTIGSSNFLTGPKYRMYKYRLSSSNTNAHCTTTIALQQLHKKLHCNGCIEKNNAQIARQHLHFQCTALEVALHMCNTNTQANICNNASQVILHVVQFFGFLAVHNSLIGDLVTNSLTHSLTQSLTFTFDIT